MKDADKRVQTPRKCIRDYCLMHCEADGKRKNSKRDVVECGVVECPLRPYRTGVLKARGGPINDEARRNRIARLEMARNHVRSAERKLEEARRDLAAKEAEKQERLERQREKDQENLLLLEGRAEEKIRTARRRLEEAEQTLSERRRRVRNLEILYNEQLEAGIWTRKTDWSDQETEEDPEVTA